jgi:hypothetical protein
MMQEEIMAKRIQFQKNDWYQLKITLKNMKPAVWRRFVVPEDLLLPELHLVIQTVMGWYNSHLHQFKIDGEFYAEPDEYSVDRCIDYKSIKLNQVITSEKQGFEYEYDFGDGWEHKIELEKILTQHSQQYPSCLAGKRACPPEDCGGPFGYVDLLKIISDNKHEEYEETMEWLGDGFDPDIFDIKEVNEMLQEDDYGCQTIDDYFE